MPDASMKFCGLDQDLRQIVSVKPGLEIRLVSGPGLAARLEIATYSGTNPRS